MIRAIAIDDEPVALDILQRHAAQVPFIHMQGLFSNALDGLKFVANEPPDLVFVDINMPGMSGLEFAQRVSRQVQLVFTTAHADYAIHGFDLAIADFLLKPISLDRFSRACSVVQHRLKDSVLQSEDEVIFVRSGHELVKIKLSDLLYVKADNNYLGFVEQNRYTLSRMTVGEVLTRLPVKQFLRVHKSYVVNLRYVDKIQSDKIIVGNLSVPLSRSRIQELKERLKT